MKEEKKLKLPGDVVATVVHPISEMRSGIDAALGPAVYILQVMYKYAHWTQRLLNNHMPIDGGLTSHSRQGHCASDAKKNDESIGVGRWAYETCLAAI